MRLNVILLVFFPYLISTNETELSPSHSAFLPLRALWMRHHLRTELETIIRFCVFFSLLFYLDIFFPDVFMAFYRCNYFDFYVKDIIVVIITGECGRALSRSLCVYLHAPHTHTHKYKLIFIVWKRNVWKQSKKKIIVFIMLILYLYRLPSIRRIWRWQREKERVWVRQNWGQLCDKTNFCISTYFIARIIMIFYILTTE